MTEYVARQGCTTVECHPVTGALVDSRQGAGYIPSPTLAALVRARDGRCRFPDCPIAARFCDLDHVQPWPNGPTSAANLAALCRRHHRIRQRPGWHVVLHPDASMTRTSPTGHTQTTHPLDRLHGLTLPSPRAQRPQHPQPPERSLPAFSRLEFALEHRCAQHRAAHTRTLRRLRLTHDTVTLPRPGRPQLIATFAMPKDPEPPPF